MQSESAWPRWYARLRNQRKTPCTAAPIWGQGEAARLEAPPRRAPDDPLDWGPTEAALAEARAALKRGDLSEAEMIDHAHAVWNSLPGAEAEQLLHRQLVTAEQYYAAEPVEPDLARGWLQRTEETGRLFDEESFGMQQYFLGPDGRVYRRDRSHKPPKALLDAYMVSSELRLQAWRMRNRRGVNERDPEVMLDLILEAYGKTSPESWGFPRPRAQDR